MVYFRRHRNTLAASLKTEIKFKTFSQAKSYIINNIEHMNEINIKYYTTDNKKGITKTWKVTDGKTTQKRYNGVIGFIYIKEKRVAP